jgi:pyruvate formate lyase activating enzyme
MSRVVCEICPHACSLKEGQVGLCRARVNRDNQIIDENYGRVTSLALDPIEKKPLYRFHPGSKILSVGSYGCNFCCSFCQNHEISMANKENTNSIYISPEDLVAKAIEHMPYGNIGLAFTYNEPTIGYEFVLDCAKLCKEKNLVTVLVTNGYLNEKPLLELLPHIDAMNIDLKSFSEDFYRHIGGNLEVVKKTISISSSACHVEVTTLIVPQENDTPEEMRMLSMWLASVNPQIPLHLSRFFPRYIMNDKEATPVATIKELSEIASECLEYVYMGNC